MERLDLALFCIGNPWILRDVTPFENSRNHTFTVLKRTGTME